MGLLTEARDALARGDVGPVLRFLKTEIGRGIYNIRDAEKLGLNKDSEVQEVERLLNVISNLIGGERTRVTVEDT